MPKYTLVTCVMSKEAAMQRAKGLKQSGHRYRICPSKRGRPRRFFVYKYRP